MDYIVINKLLKKSIYKQIADSISSAIVSRKLNYNDRLPTEKELCEIFDISQTTVKRAYDKLITEGKIRRIKGKGTFVTNRDTFVANIRAFYANDVLDVDDEHAFTKRIMSKERVFEDFGAYRALKLNYGEICYVIKVVFKDHNNPVLYQKVFLPKRFFPELESQDIHTPSLFHYIESINKYEIKNLHSTFSTINASSAEALILQIEPDDAIYFVRSIITDSLGQIIAYICNYFPGEFTEFEVMVHAN